MSSLELKKKLYQPAQNTELKYIRSSLHQYIDTGIYLGNITKFVVKFNLTSGWAFGYEHQNNANGLWLGAYRDTLYRGTYKNRTSCLFYQSGDTEIEMNLLSKTCVLKYGATTTRSLELILPASYTPHHILLCAMWDYDASRIACGETKIMSFEAWNSQGKIMSLSPMLINGRPCMYDTISDNALYNQGSGEFGYETMDGVIVEPI